jgi:hypothetical protein
MTKLGRFWVRGRWPNLSWRGENSLSDSSIVRPECPMMNPRKLVAIDIVLLGSRFIIAEFAGGVVLCVALGIFVLVRGHSFGQFVLGLYLISLGINYVPMLVYALVLAQRDESAPAEMGDELNDKRRAMAKYRRQSLLLLVPLLVPLVAVARECRRK